MLGRPNLASWSAPCEPPRQVSVIWTGIIIKNHDCEQHTAPITYFSIDCRAKRWVELRGTKRLNNCSTQRNQIKLNLMLTAPKSLTRPLWLIVLPFDSRLCLILCSTSNSWFKKVWNYRLLFHLDVICPDQRTNGWCYKNRRKTRVQMSSCVVFMQKCSSHLSVCWVCIWVLLWDSFFTQDSEIGDVCSASVEAWKTIQSMSHHLTVPQRTERFSTLSIKSLIVLWYLI